MNKKKSIIALLLLVPAPSIGVMAGLILFPDTILGKSIFLATKVWLFSFPIFWLKFIDKGKFSLSPPRKGGFLMGLFTGCAISMVIWFVYYFFGSQLIDYKIFIEKIQEIGLSSKMLFWGCATYWILVNSVLEEYVWRWFCVEKAEAFLQKKWAIIASAFCFTLHHILVLMILVKPPAVLIFSLGVFIGGAIWSFMYLKYRSVWPGYLSHAIVDLCIFSIGAQMLFD